MFISIFFSDYYKRTAGIPFVDSFLKELTTRFSADNRILKAIMSLVPVVIKKLDQTEVVTLAEELLFWERDITHPHARKV